MGDLTITIEGSELVILEDDDAPSLTVTTEDSVLIVDIGGDGPQGIPATITVGSVTTGAPGSSATVTNAGTSGAAVLDFVIPRGDPGAAGVVGSVLRNGNGAPSNSLGVDGDYYLDDLNGDLYQRSSGAYSIVANLKGPAGADGDPGAPGAPGATGPPGPAPSGTGVVKVAGGVLDDPASLIVNADVSATAAIAESKLNLGSLGSGLLLRAKPPVTVSTAGVGSPLALTASDSGKVFTNEGASAIAAFTLPASAVSIELSFACVDADGIRVTANGTDVIRLDGLASAAGGRVDSTDVDSFLTLICLSVGVWTARYKTGGWTVT